MHINYFCMPTRRTDVRSQYKYIKKEYIKSTLFHFPTFLSHEEISAREEGSSRRSHRDIPSSFLQKKKKTVSKETDHKNPHKSVMLHEFRSGISPPLSESAGFVVMAKRVVSRDQRGSSLIRNRVV